MELINEIVEARNFWEAWMSVRRNHGVAGIDKMPVEELDVYLPVHMDEIKSSIVSKRYKPSPVRRVYPELFIARKKRTLFLHVCQKIRNFEASNNQTFTHVLMCKDTTISRNEQGQTDFFDLFEANKKVEVGFSAPEMTNLGGMCVLRRITKDDDFVGELARKVREWRNPKFTEHSIKEMMDQRVLQIAAGYEDADDCDLLRKDGMMKLMVGRLPSGGDLCSQPTMTRLENHVQHKELYDMGWAFVRHFVESYDKEPVKIILDLDDSNANCYGAQQLSVFNGYYGEHCYMPLFIFEGFSGKLVVPILRPGRTNKRDNVAGLLIRLITYLRKFWPDTVIVVRGDGMFSSSEFMEWANGQKNLHYVLGFSGNSRLSQRTAAWVARAEEQYRRTGQDVKVYHRFMYRATRWERAQWIVVKMEFNAEGKNVRYVVTDMYHKPPRDVYANWYCKHGNCELYIYDKFIVMQSSHTHADAKLLIA